MSPRRHCPLGSGVETQYPTRHVSVRHRYPRHRTHEQAPRPPRTLIGAFAGATVNGGSGLPKTNQHRPREAGHKPAF